MDNEQFKKMKEEPLPVYLVIYGEKTTQAHTETSPKRHNNSTTKTAAQNQRESP